MAELPSGKDQREQSLSHKHVHEHQLTDAEKKVMEGFETLDYDVCENVLFRERKRNYSQSEETTRNLMYWFVYLAIGVLTGMCGFFIAIGVETLLEIRFGTMLKLMDEHSIFAAWIVDVVLAMAFVGVATGLVVWVEPASSGSGIPDLKAYLNGTNLRQLLTLKAAICKVIGVLFSVGGGLCVGKEGPMVHTGAVVAANLSHGWRNCGIKHWKSFRNDTDKRNFVSGGCAAGVAAAFGAPIGGVLFSLEEASSFWSLDLTWKSFFCAIVSTFTINLCISTYRGNYGAINDPGLLSFGAFVDNPYTLWEIPIFMMMAVFGGCAGGLFNALNEHMTKWRRDTMKGLKWQKNVEALIIAFVTATVFFWLPQLFNDSCHNFPEGDFECLAEGAVDKHKAISSHFDKELYQAYTCPPGTYNDMASLSFTGQEKTIHAFFHNYHHEDVFVFTTPVCVTYFIVYYMLACWTYGIMVPSGLFVPGIICGCCFGRLTGEWVKHLTHGALWTTHAVHPGTYALLGAASMLGGMARMTISLTIILLETTNDIQYLLPIMICLMISKWVGDQFNISLYDIHVELKCIPFVEGTPPVGMEQMNAYDVATRPVVTMDQVVPVQTVVEVLKAETHNGFPVITPKKKFVGTILRSQLVVLLRNQSGKCWLDSSDGYAAPPESGPLSDYYGATIDDFGTRLQSDTPGIESLNIDMDELDGKYLDLRPFMNPAPFSVMDVTPLTRVFRLYRAMGIRHLAVTNIDNEVVGILTRKELRTDFKTDLY